MGVNIPVGYGQANMNFEVIGRAYKMSVTFGYAWVAVDGFGAGNLGPTGEHAGTIANALSGTGDLLHPSFMSSDYRFIGVQVYEERGTGSETAESLVNTVGTVASSSLPPNCAFLVRKITARGGRKGRGRMFWPPFLISEGQVFSTGFASPGTLAGFQTKLTAFRSDLITAGLTPVLLHSDPVEVPDPITAFATTDQLATQRRRLR